MTNETKRRVRGWILQLLGREPVGADGRRAQATPERLQQLLFEIGHQLSIDEVRGECSYLAGKGFVGVEKFTGLAGRIVGGSRLGVRLLSLGQDVLDETVAAEGVDLGVFAGG